ncbi:glycogen debranching enzyme [Saccharothrix saharensis]|uniref:Glycogen debranching enzyme n=1 Tax=Saccharothrix saharensis TaxID=571190 RepID=A0A543J6R7_9PSEU|nr:trehalase family glycosidase [Saccharothrix saharensis]TQM78526.1 glycogen debranching enzyme [Saccharothrix saharensis]
MDDFSVREIPFSHPGAWFGLSAVVGLAAYADDLHLVSHRNGMHAVLSLTPVSAGDRVTTEVRANAALLTWSAGRARVAAAFESPTALRVSGTGLGLRIAAADDTLTPFTGTFFFHDPVTSSYVFTSYETGHRYRVTVLTGHEDVRGASALGTAERAVVVGGDGGRWELVVEELTTARERFTTAAAFADVVASSRRSFEQFTDRVAPWRTDRTPAAELACYVLWSAAVSPAGFLGRPAVLMSKNWMDKVWSWDHCFNALALAPGVPDLAWDQLQVVFDHQTPQGALPDSITHAEVLHNFVKPPVHGWAVGRLRAKLPGGLPAADLPLLYRRLAAWTTFWLDHRRAPGEVLPHYEHGNDSGWDNATVFDGRRLVQSADLAAFLVVQSGELARLARDLGDAAAATRWDRRAAAVLDAMLTTLWDGTAFTSRALDGTTRTTASLLDLMPVILGTALPPDVHAKLAEGVARHLTAVGPATERPDSPHYEADGYWRGPVWAPSTVLIEDGLRRGGAVDLADRVSARFRATCEKSGFAENFDARTGEGLRDRAYTWTAAAYLLLAADAEARRAAAEPVHTRPL